MSPTLTPTHTLLPDLPDLYPYFTSTYTSTHQSINSPSTSSFPSTNLKIVVSFTRSPLSILHFPSSILPPIPPPPSLPTPKLTLGLHPSIPIPPPCLGSYSPHLNSLSSSHLFPSLHPLRKGQIKKATSKE